MKRLKLAFKLLCATDFCLIVKKDNAKQPEIYHSSTDFMRKCYTLIANTLKQLKKK